MQMLFKIDKAIVMSENDGLGLIEKQKKDL